MQALQRLGIEALAQRGIGTISGGERQLALIARALVQNAEILIMDEPTANLDFGNQQRVLAQIRALTARGYTVLLSTHNPEHALHYSHRVLALQGGHISADIAEQLNIPFPFVEEKIKQTYSFNSTNQDETYVIPATEDEPARTVRRDEVTPIIEAKVEEIAEAINKALEEGGVKLGKWSNVYLTGGGLILNKGGKDFLAGKLHRIIREAQRTNNKMTSHVFSSAVGLTILVVTTQEEQKAPEGGAKGLFSRAFRWLMGY